MAEHRHEAIIVKVRDQFADIFDESEQSVYIYLDDVNKVCNKRFASLLGYASPKEWAAVKQNFPEAFVSRKDRAKLVSTYQKVVSTLVGSTISLRWMKKSGEEVPTTTILVPIVFEGHRMALHFISPS